MKTLQDSAEILWDLGEGLELKTVERRPSHPVSITLLLHGLSERGLRIYRKLLRYLPENSYIIAPNGPLSIPRIKPDRTDFGYAWYKYDRASGTYEVDQTHALRLLKELLKQANPEGLPLDIIGFSQGGYLAPLLGFEIPLTRNVIGVGCEFREIFFKSTPSYKLIGIHGESDQLVSFVDAKNQVEKLKSKGIAVDWYPLPNLRHEINQEVGLIIKKILESYGNGSL